MKKYAVSISVEVEANSMQEALEAVQKFNIKMTNVTISAPWEPILNGSPSPSVHGIPA